MYTVCTMHATFVVHCWVNMKPLNCTQLTNLQLCSDQSTNHNSQFGVRGPPEILLSRVPIFIDRTLSKSFTIKLQEFKNHVLRSLSQYTSHCLTYKRYQNRLMNQAGKKYLRHSNVENQISQPLLMLTCINQALIIFYQLLYIILQYL